MADNVTFQSATPATPPAGFVAAVDDISGIGYQRVKLTDGTADSTNAAVVSAAGSLAVDYREVLSEITYTSSGLTTATTGYALGDVLGSEITLTSMARANGGYFTIASALLVDKANITAAIDMFLFSAASTPAADNAANAWADADMLNLLGVIHFSDAITSANNRLVQGTNLPLTLKCGSSTTSVFAVLVTRTAHTFFGAVGDLVAKLEIVQH